MGISTRQYQDIMNEYDAVRRRNYMAEQERNESMLLFRRFAVLMRRLLMFLSQRQRRCF